MSLDLENMCTIAKLSLLELFLLSYHIIYILGKIWAECKQVLGHTNKTVHHRNIILVQYTYHTLFSTHAKYEFN